MASVTPTGRVPRAALIAARPCRCAAIRLGSTVPISSGSGTIALLNLDDPDAFAPAAFIARRRPSASGGKTSAMMLTVLGSLSVVA